MGFMLLFIEDDENRFVLDEWVGEKITELPEVVGIEIMNQVMININDLTSKGSHIQSVCGVIKGDVPFFFEFKYVNEIGEIPVFIDFNEIELEEYLDSISKRKYFKNGTR